MNHSSSQQPNKEPSEKPSEDTSYLSQLLFRASDFGALLTGYVSNMRLIALVIVALFFAGVVSFISLPRTLNPEINITIVTVSSVLPGAPPEDVESLLTIPLEDEIKSVDDVDLVTSTSREGVSLIVVQFLDGVSQNEALVDVQNSVNKVSGLPEDATDPVVDVVDFEDAPVLRYAIVTSADEVSLDRFATGVKDSLEDLDIIDRVEVSGISQQEVRVEISPEMLQTLGISIDSLARSVSAVTSSYPSGVVESDRSVFNLTIDQSVFTIDALRDTHVIVSGQDYILGQIATVSEGDAPGQTPAFFTFADGETERAVTLSVFRVIGTKISDAASSVDDEIARVLSSVHGEFRFVDVENVSADIDEEFFGLYRNLSITVFLVFLTLLVFVGIRQAFVAALSIPLVFLCAFVAMSLTGLSLNFLSIFSLLLSLGLLVDVTIVIVSAMTAYHRTGKFTSLQVGLLVWRDFVKTLSITTLTTIWAFFPLLLSTGIIGEFIKSIPIIVSSMLVASVLVGFLIILPLMVWLLEFSMPRRVRVFFSLFFGLLFLFFFRNVLGFFGLTFSWYFWLPVVLLLFVVFLSMKFLFGRASSFVKQLIHRFFCRAENVSRECFQNGLVHTDRMREVYRNFLDRVLRSRVFCIKTVVAVVVFFVFSFALVPAGFVKNEFFPPDDFPRFYVSISLPLGTKADVSQIEALGFVEEFRDVPGLLSVQTQIGVGIDSDGQPRGGEGDHNILYTLILTDSDDRDMSSIEIAEFVRRKEAVIGYAKGDVKVSEINGGPPAGADVTVKLVGDELDQLSVFADRVSSYLSEQSGVTNIDRSIKSGAAKIVFSPDVARLSDVGVTVADIGREMRLFGSGFSLVDSVDFDDTVDKRDIVLRLSSDVQSADFLGRVSVPLSGGGRVPLLSLGRLELQPNPTIVTREDYNRTLSVTASVVEGFNAQEINQKLAEFMDGELGLSQGYRWETGGANQENEESVQSILQAMLLAFVLIFLTLIVQLNSYRKSFIVLLVIPLAISGVFVVFALAGIPLSFPALIGVLALFGIVINNSIIIVDQINTSLKAGLSFHNAVLDGASSRLEPILMSSLTTIIGLLPITLTQPVWLGLGGAIISGLIFSGAIMLVFIPVVYYMMFVKEYS
ncbi:MAG: efflux RND transporter permease subunit [Candidatus Moranbacteria bacterium]|nr:efflux RND transporter permease subunit [Candidatus Moranbacteria bacterium]